MPECCVAKRGYKLECDRSLHRRGGWVGQQDNFFRYVLFE